MFLSVQHTKRMTWLLIIVLVTSILLSLFTTYDLEWEDHVSIKRGVGLFVYGLLFFISSYNLLNSLILDSVFGRNIMKYYGLKVSDVLDISNKQVSAVQAIFCCITGLTSTLYSCRRDMLKTSHYISEAYAWFGAAYFLYDIWSMYKVYCAEQEDKPKNNNLKKGDNIFLDYLKKNFVIVGHHLFIGCFGFLVITHLRGGLGDCFFGFVYLMEASTPFVSLRSILSKMGLKTSSMYKINGVLMLVTFFIFRIAMFPYVLRMYSKSISMDFIPAIISLPRGCLISMAILVLPQFYWFMLMLSGATKMLIGIKSKESQTKQKNS